MGRRSNGPVIAAVVVLVGLLAVGVHFLGGDLIGALRAMHGR